MPATTTILPPQEERFCVELVKGTKQYEAYRLAFRPKRMTRKSMYEKSSWLAAQVKIQSRIAELRAELAERSGVSLAEWLKKAERFYRADVRKLYDEFGNVKEIPSLGDNEAAMIAGIEVTEDYTKVRLNDGTQEAIPVGYTKKIKLVDPLEGHKYLGKVLGYYIEHPETPPPVPPVGRINWAALSIEEQRLWRAELLALVERMRGRKAPIMIGGNGGGNGHAA